MSTLRDRVKAFAELLAGGRTVEAIEGFYAEDAVVFENRVLARSGRAKCAAYEKAELAKLVDAPHIKIHRFAVDEQTAVAFLEYSLRFTPREGRPARLDEVAVQRWHDGRITEERFYYEGVVDEGAEATEMDG